MNTPYVRSYNDDGSIANPINGIYSHKYENRSQRHQKDARFMGNKKGISLSVFQNMRYKRVRQLINDRKTGKPKAVFHYMACK